MMMRTFSIYSVLSKKVIKDIDLGEIVVRAERGIHPESNLQQRSQRSQVHTWEECAGLGSTARLMTNRPGSRISRTNSHMDVSLRKE